MSPRVGASTSPLEVPQSLQGIEGSSPVLAAALRAHPYPLFLEPGKTLPTPQRATQGQE